MRFVPVKTPVQQALLAIHRLREGYKEDRTACFNRIRGLLTEFGIVFAQSPEALWQGLVDVLGAASSPNPGLEESSKGDYRKRPEPNGLINREAPVDAGRGRIPSITPPPACPAGIVP